MLGYKLIYVSKRGRWNKMGWYKWGLLQQNIYLEWSARPLLSLGMDA